jgi:hypothetical protein
MATRQVKRTINIDASTTWTDLNGNSWDVGVEFKQTSGRLGFKSIVIQPMNTGYPLTRSVLAQVPLLELFSESMFKEQLDFDRWQRIKRNLANHQGRASSDEELKLVAEVREAALEANFPVQSAVARVLGITKGAAGNRIKVARTRGFIPPVDEEVDE